MTTELRPEDLYRRCDPSTLPFDSTADDTEPLAIVGQERAIEAARFAIGMHHTGYNVFALGPEGVGKATVIRQLLAHEAPGHPTPPDWIYVLDFAHPHCPKALKLPAGTATRLRDDMQQAIAELLVALPAAFESDEYRTRKHQLVHTFNRRQEAALDDIKQRARDHGVGVVRSDDGITVAALRGDQLLESAEFEKLPATEQATLDQTMQQVGAELTAMFNDVHTWASAHAKALDALDREIARSATRAVIDRLRASYHELPAVIAHLDAVEQAVVEDLACFTPTCEDSTPDDPRRSLHVHDDDCDRLRRYEVNVIVDHGSSCGAPVVAEENPTYANLVGRIEHGSELGTLVTNFTLIRPGALHRASGGYLLLDAVKLLRQPSAWDALKRALRTREIRIESLEPVSTISLEPEPIPLETKVVLFGDRVVYYLLAALDPEFEELFKVMADFEPTVDRSADATTRYAKLVAALVREESLRPFDRGAVAHVIEHASRLAGDAQKLSVHLRSIGDVLREASDHARRTDREIVTAADVAAAIAGQRRRAGRLQENLLEAIRRRTLLVDTRGTVAGQINGLSLVELGHHVFGHPTRITASARLGAGEVIDIEREVELGGPVHSKGVFILAGLLGDRYAPRVPLSLSARIVFEQSYSGVDGDSASLAELCVLLSAIGDVPIRQAFAVTGSVNLRGAIQPVGSVNEKIEGFFDACREQGLTGDQGVIIPHGNVQHLMLRADVVAAVSEQRFHVHAVRDVDEAIALLSGQRAEAVNARVEARLQCFADDARRFMSGLHATRHLHAG